MRFSDELIKQIRDTSDAYSIVSEYVSLKKKGGRYWGCCPFHIEKTASFSVSPDKGVYYCHGCGVGGDIIDFVSRIEGIGFMDALRIIAEKSNIETPDGLPDTEKNKSLYEINIATQEWYIKNRYETPKALDYLKSRDIPTDIADEFRIGWAPEGWDNLLKHLKGEGFDEADIKKAGLIVKNESGKHSDIFRGRLMFPILDRMGRPIGFGGRTLDDGPKYINTPETPIFKKGEALFGIFSAGDEMKRMGFGMVVEGYIDVIACHCAGFPNTVAPMGTALTPIQVKTILRRSKSHILLFDGDSAGLRAAVRSANAFLNTDADVRVAVLPKDEDPHSLYVKYGYDGLTEVISKTTVLFDFVIAEATKATSTVQGKVKATDFLSDLLAKTDNAVERTHYIKRTADALGVPVKAIEEEVNKKHGKPHIEAPKVKKKYKSIDDEFIGFLSFEDFAKKAKDSIPIMTLVEEECQAIADIAYSLENPSPMSILDALQDENLKSRFAAAILYAYEEGSMSSCLIKMEIRAVENAIKNLSRLMTDDTADFALSEMSTLKIKRKELLEEKKLHGHVKI